MIPTRSLVLWMALALLAANAIAGDTGSIRCQAGESYVYLYQAPDNFQVLANLKCGQNVEIVAAQGSAMVRIRTSDGKEGYISKSEVTAITSATQQPDTNSSATNSPSPTAPQVSKPVTTPPQGATQPRVPAQASRPPLTPNSWLWSPATRSAKTSSGRLLREDLPFSQAIHIDLCCKPQERIPR